MRIFLSFCDEDARDFVSQVSYRLRRLSGVGTYFHPEERAAGPFPPALEDALRECDALSLFLSGGTASSRWQGRELRSWLEARGGDASRLIVLDLDGTSIPLHLEDVLPQLSEIERISCDLRDEDAAAHCAVEILRLLRVPMAPFDDLPLELDSGYEKDIVAQFVKGEGRLPSDLVERGYPRDWPTVNRVPQSQALIENPLEEERYGDHRSDRVTIRVDARTPISEGQTLTFIEAGPRSRIVDPGNNLRAGILVSGGIAPGINAVISAISDRHRAYERALGVSNSFHKTRIFGIVEGFRGLCRDGSHRKFELDDDHVAEHASLGGSIVPTARADELLTAELGEKERLFKRLVHVMSRDMRLDVLYVIGGEGSMRAAHAIHTVYTQKYPDRRLSIIGIPKTMDNDILWVWQSFGFLSAVEKARQDVMQLHQEARSNPRVGVMQLFGSASGFVVSHAAFASNVTDVALIPEMRFKMTDLCAYMDNLLTQRLERNSPHGLIVMAETAIPVDALEYVDAHYVGLNSDERAALEEFERAGRRVVGQTPDALRTAGLKVVSRVLQHYIQEVMGSGNLKALGNEAPEATRIAAPDAYWSDFRVFTNEPRHLIRSVEPTVTDMAYGARLGTMAVDMAMAGYTDCMVSQWLTEYVAVPLKLVVLGRKKVPRNGIFWRTVVAKTGQMALETLT